MERAILRTYTGVPGHTEHRDCRGHLYVHCAQCISCASSLSHTQGASAAPHDSVPGVTLRWLQNMGDKLCEKGLSSLRINNRVSLKAKPITHMTESPTTCAIPHLQLCAKIGLKRCYLSPIHHNCWLRQAILRR